MTSERSQNILDHQYPSLLLRHPRWIHLLYWVNHHLQQRNRLVARVQKSLLRNKKPKTFIDLGVGEGAFFVPTVIKFPLDKATAVDKNKANLSFLKRYFSDRAEDPEFIHSEIEKLKANDSFDMILLIGVLQYCKDDQLVLTKVKELLSYSGDGLIYLPTDAPDVISSYRKWYSSFPNYEAVQGRQRLYAVERLPDLMANQDLSIVKLYFSNYTIAKLSIEIYNLLLQYVIHGNWLVKVVVLLLFLIYLPFHILLNILDEWIRIGEPHGVLVQVGHK